MSVIVRLLFFLLLTGSLISGAEAYILTINTPDSVTVGSPLIITGSTTFPEDTYFDLVLFYSKYTAGEVKRQRVIVDSTKEFRTDFETRGLQKGQYKIEVHSIISDSKEFVENALGSSSVVRRIVRLVDRSDEISIESPQNQTQISALLVNGRVKKAGAGVLTLRAFGPDGYTFGPQQVITTSGYADKDGHFSLQVPVSSPGAYQISISDKDGFIGEYSFTVIGEQGEEERIPVATSSPEYTPTPTPLETPVSQPVKPTPSPTASSLPVFLIIGGLSGGYYLISRGMKK